MKLNNKGFIFTETLISTTIMIVLLISFYVFSVAFIDNQSKYKNYEKVENIYKVANVRLFLYRNSDDFNELIEHTNTAACVSLNNIGYGEKTELTNEYKLMLNTFNIDQLYLCDFEKDYNKNDDFKYYFNYVKKKFNDKYRIIAHIKDSPEFSSIKVWRVNK